MSGRESGTIRLKNKTAVHLWRSARRTQTAGFAFVGVFTLAMAACAVLLGIRTLLAVPLVVAAAVLLDALMVVRVRAAYFQLLGMAICTEAAAMNMAAEARERRRQRQAAEDLLRIKRDTEEAERQARQGRGQARSGPSVISLEARRRGQGETDKTPDAPQEGRGEASKAREQMCAAQTRVMPPVRETAPEATPSAQTHRRRRRIADNIQ